MRALALVFGLAVLGFDAGARAEDPTPPIPFTHAFTPPPNDDGSPENGLDEPGYFNALGTSGRPWELQTETAFSTSRVFTQRFEIARLISPGKDPYAGLVIRSDFGSASDTTGGVYVLQGPLFSVGLRVRSKHNDHWLEFGVRFIPPYSDPNEDDPSRLRLALQATLSSGQADDARWLTFDKFGYQIYADIQSRSVVHNSVVGTYIFGVHYGGRTSLTPLSVPSWLGSQVGIVGNVFVDLFVGAPFCFNAPLNAQIGLHGEASLSSIWPGNATFPLMGSFYAAWNPKTWISARVFYGFAGVQGSSPLVPMSNPYGATLAFYVP